MTNLTPAQITLLAKLTAQAAKTSREDLEVGEHVINETITLDLTGTVKVGEDFDQRIVAKAKPWNLLAAALEVANTQLVAAGLAGIDMDRVVDAAEAIDADAVKAAKRDAEREVAGRKAPTLTSCKGKVTTTGEVVAAEQGHSLEVAA